MSNADSTFIQIWKENKKLNIQPEHLFWHLSQPWWKYCRSENKWPVPEQGDRGEH